MLTRIKQIHRFYILTAIIISLHNSFGANNFKFIFDDIKCWTLSDYIDHFSCTIDKSGEIPLLNVDIQMKKEVQESRFDFVIYAKSGKKPPFAAFRAEGIRYCSAQEKQFFDPIYKTFKDMLSRSGKLPDGCPIPADFRYNFRNITIKTDFLPSYGNNAGLKIILVYYNRKRSYLNITTMARIADVKVRRKGGKKF